jgi:hypothetical protein
MIAGWIICGLLYWLGACLMIDNIRAQPHEGHPYRGYGFVLLGIVIAWPLCTIYSLIAGVVVKDPP